MNESRLYEMYRLWCLDRCQPTEEGYVKWKLRQYPELFKEQRRIDQWIKTIQVTSPF